MKFSRRHWMLSTSSLLSPVAAYAASATSKPRVVNRGSIGPKRFTATTAPDATSRLLLAKPLTSPWQGTGPGAAIGAQVSRNFARIIAQNFAAQNPRQLAAWLDRVNATDLARLGQLYSNSRALTGEPASALDVLALRLDARRLARLTPAFGFGSVAESVNRWAPHSYSEFSLLAPKVDGPVPFSRRLGEMGGQGINPEAVRQANFLDMTIEQVYLNFRTTPFVGMSVSASLFSTVSLYAGALTGAWHTGQTVGGYLVWGAQRFAPDFWGLIVDGLGGWLYNIEQLLHSPPITDPIISPEETAGTLMRSGFLERILLVHEYDYYDLYAVTGGEFFESGPWASSVPYSPPPASHCASGSGCQDNQVFQ